MKLLTLIVGESGCGKSTLTDRILKAGKGLFHKVLSTVSRPERENEENGKDYYFTSRKIIETHKERGELVQLTEFNSNLYCTREQDYFKELSPISVLSVVPEHVMTVFNYFRQPHYANDIMFQILYFDSSDALLQKHLGSDWEARVARGNIRKRFMELYPHIKQHIPIEFIDDRMVGELLHTITIEFLKSRLQSVNSKFFVESAGEMVFKHYPSLEDFEASMVGETTIVQLDGLKKAILHAPNMRAKTNDDWMPYGWYDKDDV